MNLSNYYNQICIQNFKGIILLMTLGLFQKIYLTVFTLKGGYAILKNKQKVSLGIRADSKSITHLQA